MPAPPRVEALRAFVAQRPEDPFPRYALAMEYKNAGLLEQARREFEALIAEHRDYAAAYLHAGGTLAQMGSTSEARAVYLQGISVCAKTGDGHARSELEGALALLG